MDILDYLEEEKAMDYIIAANFTPPIQRLIAADNNWIILDSGIEVGEKIYQSES